jgi:hypothetical protein
MNGWPVLTALKMKIELQPLTRIECVSWESPFPLM